MSNVTSITGRGARPSHASEMSFEQRNDLLKALCEAQGLRLPKTILPEGHALWDVGETNKRALATELERLPYFMDALPAIKLRLEQERPEDYGNIPIQTVRMNPRTGRLYQDAPDTNPDDALGYTGDGFSQVTTFIRPDSVRQGYQSTLLSLPNHIRADAFNYHAQQRRDSDSMTLRTVVEPHSGARVIRAVTSSKHSLVTGDDSAVVAVMEEKMPDSLRQAKVRYTRELSRSQMELIWPMINRPLVVGDVAMGGVRISNSETKAGALKVEAFLLRVLCANFTTAFTSDAKEEEISLKHVGDLRYKLVQAVRRALERIEPFAIMFGDAYKNPLPATRGEVLGKVQKVFELADSTMELTAKLWDADGNKSAGDTLAGLVNALTRGSQQLDMDVAGDVERAAGRLVAVGWNALERKAS